MAQKKIGIYGTLQSTANNKVEDLYLIVDGQSIIFSVKNTSTNAYVAFEYFVKTGYIYKFVRQFFNPDDYLENKVMDYLGENRKSV